MLSLRIFNSFAKTFIAPALPVLDDLVPISVWLPSKVIELVALTVILPPLPVLLIFNAGTTGPTEAIEALLVNLISSAQMLIEPACPETKVLAKMPLIKGELGIAPSKLICSAGLFPSKPRMVTLPPVPLPKVDAAPFVAWSFWVLTKTSPELASAWLSALNWEPFRLISWATTLRLPPLPATNALVEINPHSNKDSFGVVREMSPVLPELKLKAKI